MSGAVDPTVAADPPDESCGNDRCDRCYPLPTYRVSESRVERVTYRRDIKAATRDAAVAVFEAGTEWPASYDETSGEVFQRDPVEVVKTPPDPTDSQDNCWHKLAGLMAEFTGRARDGAGDELAAGMSAAAPPAVCGVAETTALATALAELGRRALALEDAQSAEGAVRDGYDRSCGDDPTLADLDRAVAVSIAARTAYDAQITAVRSLLDSDLALARFLAGDLEGVEP